MFQHSHLCSFLIIEFQSLFYWITYSYYLKTIIKRLLWECFNPYFTGLPILITKFNFFINGPMTVSILILLDYLFLLSHLINHFSNLMIVSILILLDYLFLFPFRIQHRKHHKKVSILILLDYLFLSYQ